MKRSELPERFKNIYSTFPPSFPYAFERESSDFNILEPLVLR